MKEQGEKYKTRSLSAITRAAVEDLAQIIRSKNEDTRKLHPDDATETLEILGILPRSKEFVLGKLQEIKKRNPSRLNDLAYQKEYTKLLKQSIDANIGEEIAQETRESEVLPKYLADSKTNAQEFDGYFSTTLKILEKKNDPIIVVANPDVLPLANQPKEISQVQIEKDKLREERKTFSTIDSAPFVRGVLEMVEKFPNSAQAKYWIEKWKPVYDKNKKQIEAKILKEQLGYIKQ